MRAVASQLVWKCMAKSIWDPSLIQSLLQVVAACLVCVSYSAIVDWMVPGIVLRSQNVFAIELALSFDVNTPRQDQ